MSKHQKEHVDECVKVFLACCDSALQQARKGSFGYDGLSNEQATQQARLAWSGMSRAKLFVVEPERWQHTWEAAARYDRPRRAERRRLYGRRHGAAR